MAVDPTAPFAPPPGAANAPFARYAAGVAITVAAIGSQYVVPEAFPALAPAYTFPLGLLIVYGLPIVGFVALVGTGPLRGWAAQPGKATWEGLRWYGLLSVLGLAVTFALAVIYAALDPAALRLLERPNPVLEGARSNPAFWIGFSFVIGAVEETIFRGWIFGFWRARQSPHWAAHAIWTSALFAGVHLYYGTTYGPAAPLVYPTLFLLGLAFALTTRSAAGNLVIVALLHGANDASAFLELVSPGGGVALHYGIVGVGVVVAIVVYVRSRPAPPPPSPWGAAGPPGASAYPQFPGPLPPAFDTPGNARGPTAPEPGPANGPPADAPPPPLSNLPR